ncbi:MAG: glycosyl transferase, partial [Hyphomicrobiales bacterium]
MPQPLALLLVLAVAAAVSALLCVLLRPLLMRYALARPNARSSHRVPTPQGGGSAVLGGRFAALGLTRIDAVVALFAAVLMVTGAQRIGKAAFDALMDRRADPAVIAGI